MHAASMHMNEWVPTEKAVLGLLSANHKPLQSPGFMHTNVIDRRTVVNNNNAASVDAISSRCRHDQMEIERVAAHFETNCTNNGWRVIDLASAPTTKSSLEEAWRES
jgi:hypothetical protein